MRRGSETVRYTASDTISIFHASLLWFGKNPRELLSGYGLHGWIVLLTRDQDVYDLACTLLSQIEQGSIRAQAELGYAGFPSHGSLRWARFPAISILGAQRSRLATCRKCSRPRSEAEVLSTSNDRADHPG
jgi:hypothetical protein